MGKKYSGPLGLTSGTGISDRVYEASCSPGSSQDAITDSNFGNSVGSGGARVIEQGGSSPVVNLKQLNQYITYEHFKMGGIHMLTDLLKLGDW